MTPIVAAVVQARMASSRLPGKVLMSIGETAMLGMVVDRIRLATRVTDALVATSTDAADDAIEAYCHQQAIKVFRGSHFDVLDRYHAAAETVGAEVVVRITADCPLIDPGLIDLTVAALGAPESRSFDFAATRLPPPWSRTFPIGLDVEACTITALERAWKAAREPEEREHVMPYLYKGVRLSPSGALRGEGVSDTGMRITILNCEEDLGRQRWTVDTEEDLEFVRQVYSAFPGRRDCSWLEVRELVRLRPDLLLINAGIRHKDLGEVDSRAGKGGAP